MYHVRVVVGEAAAKLPQLLPQLGKADGPRIGPPPLRVERARIGELPGECRAPFQGLLLAVAVDPEFRVEALERGQIRGHLLRKLAPIAELELADAPFLPFHPLPYVRELGPQELRGLAGPPLAHLHVPIDVKAGQGVRHLGHGRGIPSPVAHREGDCGAPSPRLIYRLHLDLDVAPRPLDGLFQRGAAARSEVEALDQPGEHRAAQHLLLDGFESGLGLLTGDGGLHECLGHLLSVYE